MRVFLNTNLKQSIQNSLKKQCGLHCKPHREVVLDNTHGKNAVKDPPGEFGQSEWG